MRTRGAREQMFFLLYLFDEACYNNLAAGLGRKEGKESKPPKQYIIMNYMDYFEM